MLKLPLLTRPRRARRGLGLLDMILSITVLAFALFWVSGIFTQWVERRALAADTSALAAIALDGQALVEGDIATRTWLAVMDGSTNRMDTLNEADFRAANVRTAIEGDFTTPSRRAVSVWIHRRTPTSRNVEIIVRGRGP